MIYIVYGKDYIGAPLLGLIASIPMITCAAFMLWYQYKLEQMESEEAFDSDNFSV